MFNFNLLYILETVSWTVNSTCVLLFFHCGRSDAHWVSLCLLYIPSLFQCNLTTIDGAHYELKLKARHYEYHSHVLRLWLTSMLHSASHSFLHMSSAAHSSSIHAYIRGGCLSSPIPCRVRSVGCTVWFNYAASLWRLRSTADTEGASWRPSNYQSTWGAKHTVRPVRYQLCVLLS